MAVVNKLSITYLTDSGTTTHNYKYVKSNVTSANVKSLITATIANKALYQSQPIAAKSAKVIQTQESEIDITEE